jgi:hypothetical protein
MHRRKLLDPAALRPLRRRIARSSSERDVQELHVLAPPSATVRRWCPTLRVKRTCRSLELRRKESFPRLQVQRRYLVQDRIGWLEATQRAEPLRCAHKMRAKPRWLVPSKLSNPCSSFILGNGRGNADSSNREIKVLCGLEALIGTSPSRQAAVQWRNAASGQSAKIPRIWTSSAKQLARTVTAVASAQGFPEARWNAHASPPDPGSCGRVTRTSVLVPMMDVRIVRMRMSDRLMNVLV